MSTHLIDHLRIPTGVCQHLDQIRDVAPSSMEARSECLAAIDAIPRPHPPPHSAE